MASRLFDALDDGVIVHDQSGTVREWNSAALGLLRLDANQLLGRAPAPPAWRATWDDGSTEAVAELLAQARSRDVVTVAIDLGTDGRRWVCIASHDLHDDDAREGAIVSTLTDVTAQREAERQNERYREIIGTLDASHRIVEESPIGMCTVDASGTVLRSNMAFMALAGIDSTSIFSLVAVEDRATLRHEFARLLDGRTHSVRMETRVQRPAAGDVWCEITAVAMRRGMPDAAILLLLEDVTERRRREIRLRQLAERDPLTGLHNRRSFERALRARLAALERPARRGCVEWALLMIDLDGFKDVNDTCGHAGGDAVLVATAGAIRDRTRVDDTVGRLGGDEFAVLFCSEIADAVAAGEQMIRRIARAAATVRGAPPVSASVGIVRLRRGQTAHAVLQAADEAMYRAKRAGKARAVEAAV